MAVFAYTATDPRNGPVDGTMIADTPRQARDLLRRRGLTVHEITARRDGNRARRLVAGRSRPRAGKLISFAREMSTLLAVGMPLLDALDTIAVQQRGRFRTILLALRERIASGASLAEAMRDQPRVFDEVTVNMVEVGQSAGRLETVLEELAAFKDRAARLRGRVGGALIYPLIVLTTGLGVSVFLMTYVVPGLLDSLIEAGRTLPLITRIVRGASVLLVTRWWLILAAAALAAGALTWFYRTPGGRRRCHRLSLRLPGIGELIRKQAVVRIAFILSTLMRSGVRFEQAIRIVQSSTRNVVLRDALVSCERAVHAGRDIAEALEQSDCFPPTVIQVFALGQSSGRLEEMLDRLSVDYDRQLGAAAAHLVAVLEPILILLLALLVGAIAFATILPILEVGNVL